MLLTQKLQVIKGAFASQRERDYMIYLKVVPRAAFPPARGDPGTPAPVSQEDPVSQRLRDMAGIFFQIPFAAVLPGSARVFATPGTGSNFESSFFR